jgi:5-methylcytosine-specific restriction endonuclease McrA
MKKGPDTPQAIKARERARAWAVAHPERVRAIKRSWEKNNPAKVRESRRQSWERNRAAFNARARAWAAANPAKVRAKTKKWRKDHPEAYKKQYARWRRANPNSVSAASRKYIAANKDARVILQAKRNARKRTAPGRGISRQDWRDIHSASLGLCSYCGRRVKLTLDHIDPLALGGEHDPDNAAAACKSCNSSKNGLRLIMWLALRRAA